MGKQSTRENKTIYQICREEAGLTRAEASEKMTAVSDSKIEKFKYEMQEPAPTILSRWRTPITARISAIITARTNAKSASVTFRKWRYRISQTSFSKPSPA